jgi:hypothetical protein
VESIGESLGVPLYVRTCEEDLLTAVDFRRLPPLQSDCALWKVTVQKFTGPKMGEASSGDSLMSLASKRHPSSHGLTKGLY